jgi:hypothetical protein
MSENETIDPIRLWREWMIKSEKLWSDNLTEMMGDERFSKGMGRYIQEGLHSHRIFSDGMAQYLSSLNLPSRADVLDIGDRLGQIEDTLAGLQVEIREQRAQLTRLANSGVAPTTTTEPKRPTRTKKPPAKSTS